MNYEKRYLQFNDLVFDGYDMISEYNETRSFKGSSVAYSYTHGSYEPLKQSYLLVSEGVVNMSITLKLKKVQCDQRSHYIKFAEQELTKPGKLWAIKNGEVIWTYAVVRSMNPIINHKQNEVEYDLEFRIPSGVCSRLTS